MAGKKQAPKRYEDDTEEGESEGWDAAADVEDKDSEAELRLRDWRDVEKYRELRELRRLVGEDFDAVAVLGEPPPPPRPRLRPQPRARAPSTSRALIKNRIGPPRTEPARPAVKPVVNKPVIKPQARLASKPAPKPAAKPPAKPTAKARPTKKRR